MAIWNAWPLTKIIIEDRIKSAYLSSFYHSAIQISFSNHQELYNIDNITSSFKSFRLQIKSCRYLSENFELLFVVTLFSNT